VTISEREDHTNIMHAIRIHSYGGPEVMQWEEFPLPVPGPGQALIRLEAASVNFLDIQQRRGELVGQAFYRRAGASASDLPATLGSQGVGIVEQLGPEVSDVRVGSRVVFVGGSYATHALAPAAWLIPVPDGVGLEQAAAGMNQGFLAYAFTHFAYPVKPGDWCLIHAAAGGIGLLLCQMAKLRGGHVIGVTSTADKAKAVRDAGAMKSSFPKNQTSRRKLGESLKAEASMWFTTAWVKIHLRRASTAWLRADIL
jgi:NADPH:quinone reductase